MTNINRRTFVATGAALLTASTSLVLLREATAASGVAADQPLGESDALSRAAHVHSSRETLAMEGPSMGEEMQRCIQLCHDCHTLCLQVIGHCVKLGGRYAAPDHIRLLMDCAQMCETTADFMARESSLHDRLCSLCAELCRLCAESCQQAAGDDSLMKQCVELCRRCAGSCERMSPKRVA